MSVIRKAINRMRPGEDIGLDYGGQIGRQRTINDDGSYNMDRHTGRVMGNFYLYHWLITSSWKNFWLFALTYYGLMNLFFASLYFWIGPEKLGGMQGDDALTKFEYCFFFSAQSFTTVGYGGLHPLGKLTNVLATLEAFVGVMTLAVATGTLYARFSKPVSRIKYSRNVIIAPYKDITGLQFMIANEMRSALVEMETRVNISWYEEDGAGKMIRRFQQVKLEIDKIAMFPTSWTINHPIDEESALYGRSAQDLKNMDFEMFILIRGFDDVFSQTIYSRHSYTADELVYGVKFRKPFGVNSTGKTYMDLTKVGDYDKVAMPASVFAV